MCTTSCLISKLNQPHPFTVSPTLLSSPFLSPAFKTKSPKIYMPRAVVNKSPAKVSSSQATTKAVLNSSNSNVVASTNDRETTSSATKADFDWHFYLIAIVPLIPSILVTLHFIPSPNHKQSVLISFIFAIVAFILTWCFVPDVAKYTLKRGLKGKDLGKRGTKDFDTEIPEALGLVTGVVFLICTIFWHFYIYGSEKGHELDLQYHSALFSICFMIFLGFTDDTLDLPWRVKMFIPLFASLPLLATYNGATSVVVPAPFYSWLWNSTSNELTNFGKLLDIIFVVDKKAFGKVIELGIYFKVYMASLAIFCTNAINILAGINGLECGQSYVIACSILFFKIYELAFEDQNQKFGDQLFAISLILPFLGASLGLLFYNWFPAKVFVGDTFCYFAGMTFAVVGIHGHFSKVLLLLFTPQIINFVLSVPQLFKLMPCPRHRLPGIIEDSRLMKPSTFPCESHEWKWLKIKADDTECPNMTILCFILRIFGPMTERQLTVLMLSIQVITSMIVFFIRYILFGATTVVPNTSTVVGGGEL